MRRLGDGKGFAGRSDDAELIVMMHPRIDIDLAGIDLDDVDQRAVGGGGKLGQGDLRGAGETDAAAVLELKLGFGIFGGVDAGSADDRHVVDGLLPTIAGVAIDLHVSLG